MTLVSYAQNFEDVILWRALRDVGQGRYLDVGAQDPEVDSVSLAFYEAGWRGIHVEATPHYAAKLREARPDEIVIEAAVTDVSGPIPFYELGGLSSGRRDIAEHHMRSGHCPREMLVPTVRLDQLLNTDHSALHWLKIDVEGMEADVLRSWGDNGARPWVLLVESTFPNTQTPTQHLWMDEVLRRGYHEVFFDGLSRYFVHESQQRLEDRFEAPANVFDRFELTRHHFSAVALRSELVTAEALLDEERAISTDALSRLEQTEQSLRQQEAAASDAFSRAETVEKRFQEEVSRTSDLQTKLLEAEQSRQAAWSDRLAAIEQLAQSECEHRASLDASWRDREAAVAELRRTFAQSESALRDALELSRASESSVRIELARVEERACQLRDRLDAAERQNAARRKEVDCLRNQFERAREDLHRADGLIRDAVTDRASLWRPLGQALGITEPRAAWRALAAWSPSTTQAIDLPLQDKMEGSMQTRGRLEGRNPYLRANSLTELLSWQDVNFVRCAYVTVLGRRPDPAGEAYYAGRLRNGHSKMEILWQLRNSAEAAAHDPGIAGFDRALRRARILGSLPRAFRRLHAADSGKHSEPAKAVVKDPQPAPSTSDVTKIDELAAAHDALATELQDLKSIVDGLGHALRGVTKAQARQERQIATVLKGEPAPCDARASKLEKEAVQ